MEPNVGDIDMSPRTRAEIPDNNPSGFPSDRGSAPDDSIQLIVISSRCKERGWLPGLTLQCFDLKGLVGEVVATANKEADERLVDGKGRGSQSSRWSVSLHLTKQGVVIRMVLVCSNPRQILISDWKWHVPIIATNWAFPNSRRRNIIANRWLVIECVASFCPSRKSICKIPI